MFRSACLVSLLLVSVANADVTPKEGSYYPLGQVGIKKQEVKGSSIHLTFKPRDEQFYWCPGVKIQKTPLATVVTFVRTKTSQDADVTVKAAIGKRLVRTVTIPTNGMDVYVRTGADSFKRIYAVPKKEETKPASVKSATPIQMPASKSSAKVEGTSSI